jgi:hypothetical protein
MICHHVDQIRQRISALEIELCKERAVLRAYDQQGSAHHAVHVTSEISSTHPPSQQQLGHHGPIAGMSAYGVTLNQNVLNPSASRGSERRTPAELPQLLAMNQMAGLSPAVAATGFLSRKEAPGNLLVGHGGGPSGQPSSFLGQGALPEDQHTRHKLSPEVPDHGSHPSVVGPLPVASAFTTVPSQVPTGENMSTSAVAHPPVAPTAHKKGLNITFLRKHQHLCVQSPAQSADTVSFLSATSELEAEELTDCASTRTCVAFDSGTTQDSCRGTTVNLVTSKKHVVIDLSDE